MVAKFAGFAVESRKTRVLSANGPCRYVASVGPLLNTFKTLQNTFKTVKNRAKTPSKHVETHKKSIRAPPRPRQSGGLTKLGTADTMRAVQEITAVIWAELLNMDAF